MTNNVECCRQYSKGYTLPIRTTEVLTKGQTGNPPAFRSMGLITRIKTHHGVSKGYYSVLNELTGFALADFQIS
jgi:hypothetical protein